MERYSFRLPRALIEAVRQKAGLIPVSRIIRRLLEKWLAGQIDID